MKKLTIIAYLQEEFQADQLLESLKDQQIYKGEEAGGHFKEIPRIQLIVTDAAGESAWKNVLESGLPEWAELLYLDCAGKNTAQCYQQALEHVQGEYAAFVDADSKYSPKAVWSLCEILEDASIPDEDRQCICIRPVYVRPEGMEINYAVFPGANGVRDTEASTTNVNLCLYSYFISRALLEELQFHEEFPVESRSLFCIELQEKVKKYYCRTGPCIRYYHALEDAKGLFAPQHQKEWYTKTLRECYLPFVKERFASGRMTAATEAAVLYLLYMRFACNMGVSDNEILAGSEIDEVYEAAEYVCRYLSYETLLGQHKVKNQKMGDWLLWRFIRHKISFMESTYRLIAVDGTAILRITDRQGTNSRYTFCNFGESKATVYAIDYEDGKLRVDLGLPLFASVLMEEFSPEITVSAGEVEKTRIYNDRLCFGRVVGSPVIYRAWIPFHPEKKYQQFHFSLLVQGNCHSLSCVFANRPAARLTASISENYWNFAGDRILQYQPAKQRFIIEKCTRAELLAVESAFCRAIKLDRTLTGQEKRSLIQLRRNYWKEKWNTAGKKPVWITYDKLYKAGDNGEYLFHYVRKNCPDVDVYYLITENSPDYERLKEDSHVLIHGSVEAKQKVLMAQLILATHTNTMSGCGFVTKGEKRYLKNLYNARIVCIQHGLTVQDIAVWQNVLCDNTRLYCCASKHEVENIRQPEYGYTDKEIRLTGLARYDGLVNSDRRQILITPTWRRNLVNAGSSGNVRAKNDFFKETEYFKVYNRLINDPRLIACAQKNNYRIIYLVHPTLSSQTGDFDTNKYVDIVAAAGDMSYEKVLTESSLMVTDYSGVQFDFAYMRKPVVYYHPASLPPHYTESAAFTYQEMGFGPVIDEHEKLVDYLCACMEKDCRMDDFYRARADEFFAYDDTDNCKRITDTVMEYSMQLMQQKEEPMADSCQYDFLDRKDAGMFFGMSDEAEKKQDKTVRAGSLLAKAKRVVKKIIS